jgi:hypothetical protein
MKPTSLSVGMSVGGQNYPGGAIITCLYELPTNAVDPTRLKCRPV